ncbi:ras-related protein Rab11C-like [Pyrus ussuriensis x Pyrus communis]|uniref:Ras-related protein Rab11C-like n=1 Tax=Pyrus ussuriensis x Pyrus communis TaxID=2448454 RepID=A0A5N5HQY3_9ROSA|nr:ras-related protein Rab11C-like [Pyrus ussuriensis x Pyrus communis]
MRRRTLKELEDKTYPFPDSDVVAMLKDLLDKKVIDLLECRQPKEMNRTDSPRPKWMESVLNPVGATIRTNPFIGPKSRTRPRPNPGSSPTSRPITAVPEEASEISAPARLSPSVGGSSTYKVVQVLKSQGLERVKVFDFDPTVLRALTGLDIKVTVDLFLCSTPASSLPSITARYLIVSWLRSSASKVFEG